LTGGFLDRLHAQSLMAEQGLDALVLTQPETVAYASGAFPGVATFWRRAGAAFMLVPADAQTAVTAIVGDLQADAFKAQSGIVDVRTHPIWVESSRYDRSLDADGDVAKALVAIDVAAGKAERISRPTQFDLSSSLALLRDALGERGLLNARVGIELGFISARDQADIELALPGVKWRDATHLVERLRAIKAPGEISKLRLGAELSSAGLAALVGMIEPGMTAVQMTAIWTDYVAKEAGRRNVALPGSSWSYIAVGGDGFAPGGPAVVGDVIKIDVGCVIDGYSSDGGRTAVLGHPGRAEQQVYDALRAAFDAGLALLGPGVRLSDVYRTVSQSMWDAGFTTYGRGHFGHGVGASVWSEEWPFISANASAVAEPSMVLAFETPYYIKGLGGFIIEDQVLITNSGIEIMAPMPRDLIEIGVR